MVFGPTGGRFIHRSLGSLHPLFWNVLQTHGHHREAEMNTELLLGFAVIVFVLMITGLFVSMSEFLEISDDPSLVRDSSDKV
jgi:hypothetical protein